MTVQEAAARVGLSAHTLRYYERVGILPRVGRQLGSGHRDYTEQEIQFLEFLKRLRATGMSVEQMRQYAALAVCGDETLEERRAMLIAHRERVCRQMAELQESLGRIEWKIEHYRLLGLERKGGCDE